MGMGAKGGAVVKVSALVPLAIPAMVFDILTELLGLGCATFSKSHIVATSRKFAKSCQHIEKEEGEPDAFTSSLSADHIETIVPVAAANERETVFTESEAVLDGADTVLIQCPGILRAIRQIVVAVLFGSDGAAFDKGNALIQNAGVIKALDIMTDNIRQP